MKKKQFEKHKFLPSLPCQISLNDYKVLFNVKAENSTNDLTLEVGSKSQKKATNIITRDKCRLEKNEGFSPQYIYIRTVSC